VSEAIKEKDKKTKFSTSSIVKKIKSTKTMFFENRKIKK